MNELTVITKSKKLMEYILAIMEIIENLYSANFTKLGSEKRNEYQVHAQSKLHYLDFVCEKAKTLNVEQCINIHSL